MNRVEAGRATVITWLDHQDARVAVEPLPAGKLRVSIEPRDNTLFIPFATCETSYSLPLLETLLELKGPAYLCDEILRDEAPDYVQKHLEHDLLGYVERAHFARRDCSTSGAGPAPRPWCWRGCSPTRRSSASNSKSD